MRQSYSRTNLWAVPTVCVVASLLVFLVSQALDHAHHLGTLELPRWLNQGGASDARDLLSATAGAIITTLGLILSITVLTLSIAATQFGQRMLRRYMRDRGTQISIGIFAATFVFTLMTLLSVTSRMEARHFVPWLSIWISVALAISCIGVLIFFVHHVAETIQVHNVISEIAMDLRHAVTERPPRQKDAVIPRSRAPDFYLYARQSGHMRQIDYNALAVAAAKASVQVQMLCQPGDFLLQGARLAAVSRDRAGGAFGNTAPELERALHGTMRIGSYRTMRQDPRFALDQLTEIALRAMSPGVNDPVTMYACVSWLGDCLRVLAAAPPEQQVYTDQDGRPRVIASTGTFDEYVRSALDPLRAVASTSFGACMKMLQCIAAVAEFVGPDQTAELRRQAELLHEGFDQAGVTRDREAVEQAFQTAIQALQQAGHGTGNTARRASA